MPHRMAYVKSGPRTKATPDPDLPECPFCRITPDPETSHDDGLVVTGASTRTSCSTSIRTSPAT